MKDILFSTLSAAINRYIQLDPESHHRLNRLRGKTIAIELLPFHLSLQCAFSENGITLQEDATQFADTTISGTPLQLMGVILTKENRNKFFADDVKMTGNIELGQHVVDLFDRLEIDWEEQLSRVVGDIPAYHTGRVIKGAMRWLRHAEKSFTQNINEYVHEEAEWFPTREALQDLFHDIDALRMDTDRLEASLNQLQRGTE